MARLHTLAVNLSSGKRRGSRSWYSNVSPSAFSEILFFRAPKAPTVIARPNGPGGQGRDQQSAESAKRMGLVYTSPNTFEPWNIHISRFQRSESRVGPDPGRWPGLLHLAPSARCQTDRTPNQLKPKGSGKQREMQRRHLRSTHEQIVQFTKRRQVRKRCERTLFANFFRGLDKSGPGSACQRAAD